MSSHRAPAQPSSPSVDEPRFRGEPAVRLRAGGLSATFLPGLGLTGVSLRHEGGELLALPGGLDVLRAGGTGGLPLLAPWANRLDGPRYRALGRSVDLGPALADGEVRTDDNGLPIHGLVAGRSVWQVEGTGVRRGGAWLRASLLLDRPAFPFPHRLEVLATVRPDALVVATTLVPTGRRRVPVAFGWHPYLRLPGTPRSRWRLVLPRRQHVALDPRGLPTGAQTPEAAESEPVGRRLFDDLYALPAARGRGRVLAFDAPAEDGAAGRSVALRCGEGYPYAQVWVPRSRDFAALEPMTVPTDALARGTAPVVAPGESFTATFSLEPTASPSRSGRAGARAARR